MRFLQLLFAATAVHGLRTGIRAPNMRRTPTTLRAEGASDLAGVISRRVSLQWAAAALTSAIAIAPANADGGAEQMENAKIKKGGASTLQQGRTISITRGVNLDRADFSGQNLKGVAFQQSIVRDANFKDANLQSASFFDATVDGSNFENADLTLANVEMAQFDRTNMKGALAREMYTTGATRFDDVANVENSDWTDTFLRKDQQKALCNNPTAKGTNPVTGVDTRESMMCP